MIPANATGLVNRGRLDRRLFDVTGLLEVGYGDGARGDLPLIAVHQPGALSALQAGDTRVTNRLPSLGMSALRADKQDAAEFWQRQAVEAPGVASIWLDGRRKLELDGSVPQIGAPAAWSAGYTGTGTPRSRPRQRHRPGPPRLRRPAR